MRLVSYNVLAAAYVRPEFYRGCAPAALEPRARLAAVLERIHGLSDGPSIICLQEAERELVDALGCQCEFFQKSQNKPDGCAILVNHPGSYHWSRFHYGDGSGHGALLLHLPNLTVATTHIKWDPPESRPGYGMGQIKELLQKIQSPAVLCGDFNCESLDPIVVACREAGFLDPFEEVSPNQTFVKEGQARRIDFLLHTRELKLRGVPMPDHRPGAWLPSGKQPSDHFPLVAYLD